MNILFCSVGRRVELIKNFHSSMSNESLVIASDNSPYAPALYFADKHYIVPKIDSPDYIDTIIEICSENDVRAVTTFIDPEIELLAKNKERFSSINVEVFAPSEVTAELCFDKFKMFKFLQEQEISTVMSWGTLKEFNQALLMGMVSFPVFVKPRCGSGSVGARKVSNFNELKILIESDPSLIIQEYMNCVDIDADAYIDTISHKVVSIFSKKKIETRIGGASKTISFKDLKLFRFVEKIVSVLEFNGPVDIDFFYKNDQYYLSEINPRFGGAYLHAYSSGVDFIKLIENNLKGIENSPEFGTYEEGVVMMMYDSVLIKKNNDLLKL